MAHLNIEIDIDSSIQQCQREQDSKQVNMTSAEIDSFIAGEFGAHYISIMIPNDGIYAELHAKKESMKKKGALFELSKDGGKLNVKIKGVFKVTAYSHIIERVKNSPDKIVLSGIYAGDWPPVGGKFNGVDLDKNQYPLLGKLL